MSLNAVQVYLQQALDGLDSPSPNVPPAQAWVLPPAVVNTADAPQLFIWGGELDEQRATMPRFTGQKRVTYDVDIWVQFTTASDASLQDFPQLLDAVRSFLRNLNLPINLLDAISGETSVIQTIGEHIRVTYAPPVASANQRLYFHTGTIHCYITEFITG